MTFQSRSLRGLSSASAVLFFALSSCLHGEPSSPSGLPAEITATLLVNTEKSEPVNPMLLGLNCSWPENQYGKIGYNNPDAQQLIQALRPTVLRFPHGVWANFYDWESDGRRITDNYVTPYDSAVKDHSNLLYGFDSLAALRDEIGFKTIFTWNVNYDSPEKGSRRLLDRRERGFAVKWIELGNETFWKTQRSEQVSDVKKYLAVSQAHTSALKAIDPTLKVSVPIHWREAVTNPWNQAFLEEDYFDAITIHKYISKNDTAQEFSQALDARREFLAMAEELRTIFPKKPLWITEWAVEAEGEIARVIGNTDVWLGFINHPEIFEIASYFQINAKHPFVVYDRKKHRHRRTVMGIGYDMIHRTFHGSELLESEIEATQIGHGFDAIAAEAVTQDGKTIIFAVNKTAHEVPLAIKIDGKALLTQYQHRALLLEQSETTRSFAWDEEVVQKISATKKHFLPPFSLNEISLLMENQ